MWQSVLVLSAFIIHLLTPVVDAGASLIGVGSVGSGGGGGGGGASLLGASFRVDTTSDPTGLTHVTGRGLSLNVDQVNIAVSGGQLQYTPNHIEYTSNSNIKNNKNIKSNSNNNVVNKWKTVLSDKKIAISHNDRPVLQLTDRSSPPLGGTDGITTPTSFSLAVLGQGIFEDIILNNNNNNNDNNIESDNSNSDVTSGKSNSHSLAVSLCLADKLMLSSFRLPAVERDAKKAERLCFEDVSAGRWGSSSTSSSTIINGAANHGLTLQQQLRHIGDIIWRYSKALAVPLSLHSAESGENSNGGGGGNSGGGGELYVSLVNAVADRVLSQQQKLAEEKLLSATEVAAQQKEREEQDERHRALQEEQIRAALAAVRVELTEDTAAVKAWAREMLEYQALNASTVLEQELLALKEVQAAEVATSIAKATAALEEGIGNTLWTGLNRTAEQLAISSAQQNEAMTALNASLIAASQRTEEALTLAGQSAEQCRTNLSLAEAQWEGDLDKLVEKLEYNKAAVLTAADDLKAFKNASTFRIDDTAQQIYKSIRALEEAFVNRTAALAADQAAALRNETQGLGAELTGLVHALQVETAANMSVIESIINAMIEEASVQQQKQGYAIAAVEQALNATMEQSNASAAHLQSRLNDVVSAFNSLYEQQSKQEEATRVNISTVADLAAEQLLSLRANLTEEGKQRDVEYTLALSSTSQALSASVEGMNVSVKALEAYVDLRLDELEESYEASLVRLNSSWDNATAQRAQEVRSLFETAAVDTAAQLEQQHLALSNALDSATADNTRALSAAQQQWQSDSLRLTELSAALSDSLSKDVSALNVSLSELLLSTTQQFSVVLENAVGEASSASQAALQTQSEQSSAALAAAHLQLSSALSEQEQSLLAAITAVEEQWLERSQLSDAAAADALALAVEDLTTAMATARTEDTVAHNAALANVNSSLRQLTDSRLADLSAEMASRTSLEIEKSVAASAAQLSAALATAESHWAQGLDTKMHSAQQQLSDVDTRLTAAVTAVKSELKAATDAVSAEVAKVEQRQQQALSSAVSTLEKVQSISMDSMEKTVSEKLGAVQKQREEDQKQASAALERLVSDVTQGQAQSKAHADTAAAAAAATAQSHLDAAVLRIESEAESKRAVLASSLAEKSSTYTDSSVKKLESSLFDQMRETDKKHSAALSDAVKQQSDATIKAVDDAVKMEAVQRALAIKETLLNVRAAIDGNISSVTKALQTASAGLKVELTSSMDQATAATTALLRGEFTAAVDKLDGALMKAIEKSGKTLSTSVTALDVSLQNQFKGLLADTETRLQKAAKLSEEALDRAEKEQTRQAAATSEEVRRLAEDVNKALDVGLAQQRSALSEHKLSSEHALQQLSQQTNFSLALAQLQITAVQKQVDEAVKEEVGRVKVKVDSAQQQVQAVQAEITALQKEHTSNIAQATARLTAVETSAVGSSTSLTSVHSDIKAMQTLMSAMQQQFQQQQADIRSLQEENSKLRDQLVTQSVATAAATATATAAAAAQQQQQQQQASSSSSSSNNSADNDSAAHQQLQQLYQQQTDQSLSQLRQMVFDLQAQMVTHTGKVLDYLDCDGMGKTRLAEDKLQTQQS